MSKISRKRFITGIVTLVGVYALFNYVENKKKCTKYIGRNNRDLEENSAIPEQKTGWYQFGVKPILDKVLAFMGLLFLAPLYVAISLAIFIDEPGPVIFTQKRVGKDKHFFLLHKFRSMRMDTPHDVPTHQLCDPEQYITRIGKILRKTSLDELPQIWDIFIGNMSVIGPRPALWNQEDLVAERDKYGANNVKPGLTGWAQINGRDELEICEKARLDGEYVRRLQQGGLRALFFDVKCFLGTVKSVASSEGVVEGGTGKIHRNDVKDAEAAGFKDYGYKKSFYINRSVCRRVLITGANSYIGEYFESYVKINFKDNFLIDTVDMIGNSWRKVDFSSYDIVFHVAGIAHADVGNVDEETKKKYYAVNTDLAIETAKAAKNAGVKQFIFMSSMIIYGDSARYGKKKTIDEYTIPIPANFYGDSKWQADKGVRKLESEDFHVAVLRPPMIYGRGSKGNYPILSSIAKRVLIFPDADNQRSMLYIDNLCEFLCLLMLSGESGIYFPQNKEYTKTAEMVREIAKASGRKVCMCRFLNLAVAIGGRLPGKVGTLINKAFGSCVYTQKISTYAGMEYQIVDLKESVGFIEK